MSQLNLLVEGQSEEKFVKTTLTPYLARFGIHTIPNLLWTKRLANGGGYRGGSTSWYQIKRDAASLLRSTNIFVTTILDYYALNENVPGYIESRKMKNREDAINHLEESIYEYFNNERFIPFFALHEFETWIFSDPETAAAHLGDSRKGMNLKRIVSECGQPEAINHGKDTHPKARIKSAFPQYKETSDGPQILDKIGIDQIRAQCPHFNNWIKKVIVRCGEGS